jgi:GT2 family glycosyltransferase
MVLNWNGAAQLRDCLPSVLAAAREVQAEVWVVDNASDDDSGALCHLEFPDVRFEALPTNRSLASYNVAAERCDATIFVALNNDIIVERNFLRPLLENFEANDVFAVSPWMRPYEHGGEGGEATSVRWTRGMLRGGSARSKDRATPVFYNSGGATAYNRVRFLALGGFDELFFPLYYEDTDLSWRAWKRGWRCLHEPRSVVYHKGGATVGRSKRIQALILRNEFLFHWKNLSDRRLVLIHLASVVPRLLVAAARRDSARLRGFALALGQLRAVWARREAARRDTRLSDSEAMRRVNSSTEVILPPTARP